MIVFHHIPKTGGVAILANIARCNPQMKIAKRDAPFRFSGKLVAEDCDLLHGHFAYEQIPPGAVRFTFARHPIARFSSCFYSLRQVLRGRGIHSIADYPGPQVWVSFAGEGGMMFRKEQVWFLDRIEDFTDEFLRTQGTFGLDLVPEIFTPDYTRHYDFIGITERMGPSIEKLGALLKTDASAMTICNVSNSGPVRYRLRELQAFYGEGIETYRRLCAA